MACSCLWKGSMAGADGEDTFMKNSVDTHVARLCYNRREGEILIWTPCPCDQVYFQHPFNFHANLSTRSPNNAWDILSKAVSLPRRINEIYISVWEGMKKLWWNWNDYTSQCLRIQYIFHECDLGWVDYQSDFFIKASHAVTERPLRYIMIFAWDMARGNRNWNLG